MGLAAKDLTLKQERLAELVASNSCKTVTEAGRKAGYSMLESTSRALRSVSVQRTIEVKRAQRLDSARELRLRCQRRLGPAIDNENDAMRLAGVAKLMTDVETAIDESIGDDPHMPSLTHKAGRQLERAFIAGYMLCASGRTCRIVNEHRASAHAVAQPTGEAPNAKIEI